MEPGVLSQYANVFIPLGVSLATAIGTFLVYREKVRRLEDDVKEIKQGATEIRDKVIACETSLKERGPVAQTQSPMTLTERGLLMLKNSGGENFIDENISELQKKVENKGAETGYDIQENSRKVLFEMVGDKRFIKMKVYLYDHGEKLEDLILAMGVHLRDKILENKNINKSEIDIHDPSKNDQAKVSQTP